MKIPNKSPLPTGFSSTVSPQPLRFRPAAGLDVRFKNMIRTIIALIALLGTLCAIEQASPNTPATEDNPSSEETIPIPNFCIVDYGENTPYGRPTNFWIDARGHVHTQTIGWSKNERMIETRHEYDLTAKEFKRLQALLDVLRTDSRVMKIRDGNPDETVPIIAFRLLPHSDLFVREKFNRDKWTNFTAVTDYLSDLHSAKIKGHEPTFTRDWDSGQGVWQPDGFMSLKLINSLRYIGSDPYNAILDKLEKREQMIADQLATKQAEKHPPKVQASTSTSRDGPQPSRPHK